MGVALKFIQVNFGQTECVVNDDLAYLHGLARCKPGTEVVYVGKRGGMPSLKQPGASASFWSKNARSTTMYVTSYTSQRQSIAWFCSPQGWMLMTHQC